jgi:DNA-binding PadR family transcriptional regulator
VLVALLDGPRHGYEIVRAIESDSGKTTVYPANLYRRIRDLAASGLLEEVPAPVSSTDSRRRYMSVTTLGRRVATAEARRLSELVGDPRVQRLLAHRRSL